jgi:hypothetical protein
MVNINYVLIKSIWLFALLMICLVSVNCDENVTNPTSEEHSFEISYPLNHKSVYASQLYFEHNDSLQLYNLLIYSVQFMENRVTGDTLFYKGVFNEYSKWYDNNTISIDSSEITIVFWENWVLLQENKSRFVDKRILTKSTHTSTDTTILFIWETNYFPMYPRYLHANNQASLLIPTYSALQTFTFATDRFEKWADIFGEESGLRYTVCDSVMYHDEPTNNYSTSITGLIDKHGLILSQKSRLGFIRKIITDPPYIVKDSVMIYDLTRRIIDFTDPANIVDLSVYATEVQEKGLKFFIKNLE